MPEDITLLEWLGRADGQIALVFTDIVGSTKLALSKGDDEWVRALKCHFRRARELKGELHGYEVKLIGDACMMAFKTAWPALQFALDFYRFTGHEEIKIRAVHIVWNFEERPLAMTPVPFGLRTGSYFTRTRTKALLKTSQLYGGMSAAHSENMLLTPRGKRSG